VKRKHIPYPADLRVLVEDSQRLKTTEIHQNNPQETVVINSRVFTKQNNQIILEKLLGYNLYGKTQKSI